MYRRLYLATAAGLAAGVAGCSAFAEDDAPTEGDDDDGSEDDSDPEPFRDGFSDLEAWSVIDGQFSADDGRSSSDDQAGLLEAADAPRARIRRSFEEPLDMRGEVPGLAVAAEATVAPMIHLVDREGNWVEYRQSIVGGTDLTPLNWGITADSGAFDRSAIAAVIITMWTGEATNRLWVDDLHRVPATDESAVMVQFDGGYEQVHEVALPLLKGESIPAVTFVPPGRLRESNAASGTRLTHAQVGALDDAGWTIASETYRDRPLAGLDRSTQESALTDAIEWLEENGYDARFVAIPQDAYDDTTLELVTEHHDFGFASRIPVHGTVENPALVPRVNDPSPEMVTHYLDLVERHGGVASLCYHRLEQPSSIGSLETAVTEIASRRDAGSIEVVTPEALSSLDE